MQLGLPRTPGARARTLMLGLVAAALVASGCGSSGEDGATTAVSTAAATAAADTTAADPALAAAKATVAKYSQVPQDIGVSEPLKQAPTGTVVFMRCSQPICERQSQGTEAAAKAMGMKFAESPPQGFTPETVSKAWKAGLALKPSIIVAPGTPTQLYQAELKQAGDAKIPVVTWSVPDAPGTVSIYGNEATALTQGQMAQFIAADAGGKGASTLYLNLAGGGVPAGLDGFKEGYAKACPDCKLTVLDIAISDLGRPSLASKVVSAVQKDPSINWITGTFGDMYIGVPQALQSAGIDGVKAITIAGQQANYEYIKAGQQTADVGFNMEFFGFKALDVAARMLAGQDPENTVGDIPIQFLTQENLDFPPSEPWPSVPDFPAKFTALWGGE
ncbi:sugar ABC transporter substrate-binding protein [Capillimicrobium parvum]|uniref:Periplasmic binding protein domain-containing protein n=1 Tax=Capillimicrobium parvum TaxID=2884022 RepID=A0A9E6XZ70_9ACTN|nr:substrate-binding domain-containing protein [Capillimicrobium parvum]UGS37000.1 hypothetical protein DSM104329_03412 [Capillimicrobium parvum]